MLKHLLMLIIPVMAGCTSAPNYLLAISTNPDTGREIIYNVIDSVPDRQQRELPYQMTITWDYDSDTGMPSATELARMYEMEDLIKPEVERQGMARWAYTATGENWREWVFYTSSDQAFVERVRKKLSQGETYPIELTAQREPGWDTYRAVRSNIVENP